jgi:signal transduction histidine kinase
MVASYSVGRYATPRRSWLALPLALAFWLGWMAFDPLNEGASMGWRLGTAVWMSPSVMAWLAGALVRVTVLYREQRVATREQQASRALAEERNRIARELHDVVGHSLSVMTVQAAAVRRRLRDDQGVEREALESVEDVGREALVEMRRLVGVLREQDGETATREPSPGLAQLERLADHYRSSGLPVSVTVTGSHRELPHGLDLTAYRLVQEGLTNALRHARGASAAEVVVDYDADTVRLHVADDGAAAAVPPAEHGGHGLVGMRERVAMYGGSLRAGPRDGGGFELVAVLPTGASG